MKKSADIMQKQTFDRIDRIEARIMQEWKNT